MANGQGSFTFGGVGGASPVLSGDASQIVVCKYDANADFPNCYTVMPNIQCHAVTTHEGLEPHVAQFSYVLDDTLANTPWPTQYEQIFAIIENRGYADTQGEAVRASYVVQPSDRIVVLRFHDASGISDFDVLFDGFAEAPELGVGPRNQTVTFSASDVSIRLWDHPLSRRLQRDSLDTTKAGKNTRHYVDGPVIFNPHGRPNATADNHDETGSPYGDGGSGKTNDYPIFLDELRYQAITNPSALWTLSKFARYLMAVHNDETYVANPNFQDLDKILRVYIPKTPKSYIRQSDINSNPSQRIYLGEYEATGHPWPHVLQDVLRYNGFTAKYLLSKGSGNKPLHQIAIYPRDGIGLGNPVTIAHQQSHVLLDPDQTNTNELSITRDYKDCFNAVIVDTKSTLWEISVILAPAFAPAVGDETGANRKKYKLTTNPLDRDFTAYRWYVADEGGEGHWDFATAAWVNTPLDLSSIMPDVKKARSYCQRRRPAVAKLETVNQDNQKLNASLSLSRDYEGGVGVVWDGTGTWQPITHGWELLKTQLGIEVNCEDPENWPIGDYDGPNPQETSSSLYGVTCIANPGFGDADPPLYLKRFYLRLTCVIESDARPVGIVKSRASSALLYPRVTYAGAREQYAVSKVAAKSENNTSAKPKTVRDDTSYINALANTLQRSHENPKIAGRVVIPYIDTSFPIGEIVTQVAGRGLNLQINTGTEQGEIPRYPTIVGITYELSGRQATILQLEDFRAPSR